MSIFSRGFFVTTILLLTFALAGCSSATPETAVAEPAAAPAVEATKAPEPAAAPSENNSGAITFAIDPAQSEARFVIDELLMGSPKTVIGTNSTVSGEVTVNPGKPGGVAIGPITIDANDFAIVRSMVFLSSILYIVGLILTDISYTLVDPRIRFSS